MQWRRRSLGALLSRIRFVALGPGSSCQTLVVDFQASSWDASIERRELTSFEERLALVVLRRRWRRGQDLGRAHVEGLPDDQRRLAFGRPAAPGQEVSGRV
jgi:hypothetical protein